ncbi:SDR family oxidoreductase [Methylophilus sp. Leaf408]|uniref:dTDP-4-dehydrorhamnose reductase family protein n=1 Tax=Methylophilus sp. Leaf408 TaxID=2876561 RepID=UPI001E5292F7|nr:SDR family oxidoreductase [Methylophilus sp. Leaf408]
MRVLILGISGMLGSAMYRFFSEKNTHEVWGTVRNKSSLRFFSEKDHASIISDVDVLNHHTLVTILAQVKPDYVINCIGLVKQLAEVDDPLITLPVNALLPHQLARLCALGGARLLQISTDCVFSGNKGNYAENDISDATDLYGKSKFIGELDYAHTVTVRTSIVGHELQSKHSLVDWFLSQKETCKGYTKAIFSGLPTITLAGIIHDYIIPNTQLSGVFHVASSPVSKFELLSLIALQYDQKTALIEDNTIVIDRSLNADKFKLATGYVAPSWPVLIKQLHQYYQSLGNHRV